MYYNYNYKKALWVFIIILVCVGCSFRESSNNKVVSPYQDTVYDKTTHITFYLDTCRTIVYAYSGNNKLLWKSHPREDNHIREYRISNPRIYGFYLDSMWFENHYIEILKVKYNNSQRLLLNKQTGEMLGCAQL